MNFVAASLVKPLNVSPVSSSILATNSSCLNVGIPWFLLNSSIHSRNWRRLPPSNFAPRLYLTALIIFRSKLSSQPSSTRILSSQTFIFGVQSPTCKMLTSVSLVQNSTSRSVSISSRTSSLVSIRSNTLISAP